MARRLRTNPSCAVKRHCILSRIGVKIFFLFRIHKLFSKFFFKYNNKVNFVFFLNIRYFFFIPSLTGYPSFIVVQQLQQSSLYNTFIYNRELARSLDSTAKRGDVCTQ